MQPDVYGMVQQQDAVEERLEKIEAPKVRKDTNDIVYIMNIDTDCFDTTYDVIRTTEKWVDKNPESRGRVITRFRDITTVFKHQEGFTVKFSNQPITIPPGQVMKLPRYIAEHYAEKLADHMLDKFGPDKMKRNDPVERPAMIAKIVIKEEPFMQLMPQTVGQQAMADIQALNEPPAVPFTAPDPRGNETAYNTAGQKSPELSESDAVATSMVPTGTGSVRTTQIEPTEQVIARIGVETPDDALNVPPTWQNHTKSDLIKLIRDMTPDFQFGSNVSKSQLVGILERNY